jgi:hypothetical protein
MPKPDKQTQEQHENYWQAVADVAESIVAEVRDADPDDDRDEMLYRLLHENTDDHDYVIRDSLQVHTLHYSQHPCAALFNGTLLGERFRPGDNFPFASFAAEAFEMDVAAKVKKLLGEADTE